MDLDQCNNNNAYNENSWSALNIYNAISCHYCVCFYGKVSMAFELLSIGAYKYDRQGELIEHVHMHSLNKIRLSAIRKVS
jgi:hypothetical protein